MSTKITGRQKRSTPGQSVYVYENFFSKMFEVGKEIPREYLPLFARMLEVGTTSINAAETAPLEKKILIPIKDGE